MLTGPFLIVKRNSKADFLPFPSINQKEEFMNNIHYINLGSLPQQEVREILSNAVHSAFQAMSNGTIEKMMKDSVQELQTSTMLVQKVA